MKNIGLMLLALTIALAGKSQTSEQFTVPLTNPEKRATIKLDQVNGNITVTGYSGKEVIINAVVQGEMHQAHCDDCGDDDKSAPPGMKQINVNPMELRARETNNVVEISSDSWKRRIDVEIKVPIKTDLDLHTVHGKISISDVSGLMELSGVNGQITATNISGSIVSNTVNGDIKITFKSVTSGEPMSFVTLNGDVDVTLPPNVKATAKLRSDRGNVYTDFDMNLERSKTNVKKEDGQYEISINSWVFGKMNGGGPEYTFKNMQGDIIVRKGN